MDANQAWQTVLGQLQMEMPRASYDTWVRDTSPMGYEDGLLTVGVRNAYARDWLESRLASTVSRLLIGIMNRTVDVDFVVSQSQPLDALEEQDTPLDDDEAESPSLQLAHSSLNPRYTFESFVVGAGNRLAHAAAQAVAEKPAKAYNPLFL
ncbi:MAG: chromosomal replication initiator protein DnaA, partial [Anaerolineae bacterium]|nr:chromosomal replication initiator protein DnaA [Anaerolineae bacterium]